MKPKGIEASFGTTVITATVLFIISILFSRVTVNVLVFVLRVVFFHLIVYVVTRYMYDVVRRDFALSASFLLECFDGSEVQKENCVAEETKEVKLRSRRAKFIYFIGLNQVSQIYFRHDKLP